LQNVIVLAATNRIDLVDPAVIRRLCSGGNPIFIPNLEKEDRKEAFEIHSRGKPLAEDVDFKKLSELTGKRRLIISFQDKVFDIDHPFNGDEIRSVCEESVRIALDDFVADKGDKANDLSGEFVVSQSHFEKSIRRKLMQEKKTEKNNTAGEVSPEEIDKAVDDFKLDLDEEEPGASVFDPDDGGKPKKDDGCDGCDSCGGCDK